MLLQEVIAIESDAQELSAWYPLAKIGNHRILNGSVSQIPSGIGGQKSDSRAGLHPFLARLPCDLCVLRDLHHELSTCAELPDVTAATPLYSPLPNWDAGLDRLAWQEIELPARAKHRLLLKQDPWSGHSESFFIDFSKKVWHPTHSSFRSREFLCAGERSVGLQRAAKTWDEEGNSIEFKVVMTLVNDQVDWTSPLSSYILRASAGK
jgi:hypothetical protein